MPGTPRPRAKPAAAQSAGDLFGTALAALLDDTVSPEILHQLIDLAVALRDHEKARAARKAATAT